VLLALRAAAVAKLEQGEAAAPAAAAALREWREASRGVEG